MRKLGWLAIGALLLVLAGCIPVRNGVNNAINAIGKGSDGATLTQTVNGVTFDPGQAEALDAILYVGGTNLTTTDARCKVLGKGDVCVLGNVTTPANVPITGCGALSANVSYYRADQAAPLFFYVQGVKATCPATGG